VIVTGTSALSVLEDGSIVGEASAVCEIPIEADPEPERNVTPPDGAGATAAAVIGSAFCAPQWLIDTSMLAGDVPICSGGRLPASGSDPS